MRLTDVLPGAPFDPSPLARMRPGETPLRADVVAPAALVQGVAYVPVPGQRGLPGTVAGSLPWSNITDKPTTFTPTTYTHQQTSPDTLWSITHNLGRHPNVLVVDSAGTPWQGSVEYLDVNHLQIEFGAAFSGIAVLN